ncbi:MAG: hypothetical protein BV458_12630 [Thermoplasmata archaeon M9B2D]|nr:MAG: hypothetical protein BV458_12630 [Thermoplasmata archaeon M9B2D]
MSGIFLHEKTAIPLKPVVTETADKKHLLENLRIEEIGECTRCRLSEKRTNIVFGEGNPESDIMFIGEGPGEDEDRQGRPFVGRAGQVLRSLIKKMGFAEKDVYIANVVKCRPPGNRNPEQDEVDSCIPFLKKQIDIISPKVIVLLGNVALQHLTGSRLRITAARGKFMEYKGIKVMPTFHPSYLLRNPKDKWLTWEDAVMVLRYLGMAVKEPGS